MDAEIIATTVAAAASVVAVVLSGIAVRYSARSANSAATSALEAERQREIQRQVHMDANQPYVWADVRPDDSTGTLINLVIGNSGRTVATNVRIEIDPPLPRIEQFDKRIEAALERLLTGLQSLPPGRTYAWVLGQGFNLIKDAGLQEHRVTINADGPFGAMPELSYIVDISSLRGAVDRPTGSIHELTQAVKKLGRKLDQPM